MSRLPVVGGDANAWGSILNDYLSQSLDATGGVTLSGQSVSRTLPTRFSEVAVVEDYGAAGDGATNDATALAAALASNAGTIVLQAGKVYRCNSTLTLTTGKRIISVGAGPAAVTTVGGGQAYRGAVIEHNFNGTLFNVTGVSGNNETGAGTTFENLIFRQVDGAGAGTSGNAIDIIGATDTFTPSWIRIRNCNFETGSGKNDWAIGVNLDGSGKTSTAAGGGLRDIWIENSRINVGTNGTAAISGTNVGNIFLSILELNGTNGGITITAPAGKLSSGIFMSQVSGNGTLSLNAVQNCFVTGGSWNTVTTTATVASSVINPGFITNTPASPASATVWIMAYINALSRYAMFAVAGGTYEIHTQTVGINNGSVGVIGTLDSQNLNLVTGNTSRMALTSAGDILLGPGGLLSTAASGFPAIPLSTGAPTGTPGAIGNFVPMVYDNVNNRIYIYNGAWRSVAVT